MEDNLVKKYTGIHKMSDNKFLNLFKLDALTDAGRKFDYYFVSRRKEKELKIEGILKDWMNTIRRVVLEDKDIAEKVYRKSVEGCLAEMLAYSFENKVKVPDAIASVTTVTINGKKEKMRTPVYMGVPNSTDARQIVQKYYRRA